MKFTKRSIVLLICVGLVLIQNIMTIINFVIPFTNENKEQSFTGTILPFVFAIPIFIITIFALIQVMRFGKKNINNWLE